MKIVAAINEWSCALASLVSLLNDAKIPVSQESIIERFSSQFPEWHFRKGLLTSGGVLRLIELFDIDAGYILFTNNKDEFLKAFNDRQSGYFGSFLFTRKPTAHCRRIIGLTADILNLMEPHPTSPQEVRLKWSELEDSDYRLLLLAQ